MEKRIVGTGFLALYNNKTRSVNLNGEIPVEYLQMEFKVVSSPYLTSNRLKIDLESDLENQSVVTEIFLEKAEDQFIKIDYRKLPGVSTLRHVNRINFYCDYDIELEVKMSVKLIGFGARKFEL